MYFRAGRPFIFYIVAPVDASELRIIDQMVPGYRLVFGQPFGLRGGDVGIFYGEGAAGASAVAAFSSTKVRPCSFSSFQLFQHP